MKNKIILLLGVSITFITYSLNAQEFIKTMNNYTQNYSIAEEVNKKKYIIYSYSSSKSEFVLVTDDLSNAPVLSIPSSIVVNDMERWGNTAYFCGYQHDASTNSNYGLFGYFNLTTFPSSTINYIFLDSIKEAKRMMLYKVSETFHVAMTAVGDDDYGYCIDAMTDPDWAPGWTIDYGRFTSRNCLFYDIARTTNYIAISFKGVPSTLAEVAFCQKPVLRLHSFISSGSGNSRTLTRVNPVSDVLIKNGSSDTLYAVYKTGNIEIPVYRLNGPSIVNYNLFNADVYSLTSTQLKDISVSKNLRELNILLNNSLQDSHSSLIWNIKPAQFQLGGTIIAHKYYYSKLFSLTHSSFVQGNVIVTGNTSGGVFRLNRTNTDVMPNCANTDNIYLNKMNISSYNIPFSWKRSSYVATVHTLSGTTRTETVSTMCQFDSSENK